MTTRRSSQLLPAVVMILLAVMAVTPAFARDDDDCSAATLNGLYVFSARGFVTPPGATPFPKAIVELLRFDGDGNVTTPAVTTAIDNQPLIAASPGGPGHYTVVDLVPPDGACLGTLTFTASGITFNLVIPREGAKTIWLIQTNVTPGNVVTNVFQGTAVKIAH
jgi:hypothetical protein